MKRMGDDREAPRRPRPARPAGGLAAEAGVRCGGPATSAARLAPACAPAPMLSVAVAGGKGGVGKTSLAANLAVRLADLGRRVLLLDGDLGLANVDLLLGLAPRRTLYDVVRGDCTPAEVLLEGPGGVRILPAASGIPEMANLDDYRRERLVRALAEVTCDRDALLIDTGPGIQQQTIRLAQIADEILVVTTPEPTAFADAYATLKVLAARPLARAPRLVVTMARDLAEAQRVAERVRRVARRFLDLEVELYGVIPRDGAVGRAVRAQRPFVRAYPDSPAATAVRELADRLLAGVPEPRPAERPARLRLAA